MRVVWFKRDLRVVDHRPLAQAVASGEPVVPLYVVEPGLWALPESSGRQFAFLTECVSELARALRLRGADLVIKVGEVVDVLDALHRVRPITAVHAHEETGLAWTYARDKAVARWAKTNDVAFVETPQHGVWRAHGDRKGWAKRWDAFMGEPVTPAPTTITTPAVASDPWPPAEALGLAPDPCPERQAGGREAGLDLMASFLDHRGRPYRRAMSSPEAGAQACSRLSPHLAFGTVSMREAAQAAWTGLAQKRAAGDSTFAGSLNSFIGRLHWHCHFIQKLEDEPAIESRNLHRAYDGMRDDPAPDDPRLTAWLTGQTGLPFVDACMRSLRVTGWLNFRMRAMVMAVSSYHLWMHWRAPAQGLAQLFTDFEPGIHYPQCQMQSGTTGINTARIYNPVKQSQDQDPDGTFVRQWAPELAGLPDAFVHEPWKAPEEVLGAAGVRLGETYPERIVDHAAAARSAREKIYAARRGGAYRAEADAIQDKHGSRKSGIRNRGQRPSRKTPAADPNQASLDL